MFFILQLFILSSCATMSDSLILGVGSGAAVGAAYSSQTNSDAGTGAAIGAAIGGITAYFTHHAVAKREERIRRETLLNLEKFNVSAPQRSESISVPTGGGHFLTRPVVDMDWVDTQVQGDKLIEGHRVWKIIEKPKWIPSADSKKENLK